MLALNRRIARAVSRTREGNFELDGLLGFDMHGRTVGIIGTGTIGTELARIMKGFGCHLLGYDVNKNPECKELGLRYVEQSELYRQSDIISLHCPLIPKTHHLIDRNAISKMKDGVMLINTSRGALLDSVAAIEGLKSERIGYLGLDVYEEEEQLFFHDLSSEILRDDVLARLLTFPNVIVTGHQAFFTGNALEEIAVTTLTNVSAFEKGEGRTQNEVRAESA
jgi:D-lactate dehydrogenase